MTSWTTVVLLLGITTGIQPNIIIEGPTNIAATYGTKDVSLNCTVSRTTDEHMEWRHFLDASKPDGTRIYSTVDGIIPDSSYAVDRRAPDGNGYEEINLIVKEVTKEVAGQYQCGIILATGQKSEAELVTLSPLTCNPSPGEETVDEGDLVDVSCIVEYTGYEAPNLNWAEISASPGESNDTHSKSTSSVVAGRHHDMMELTCLLSFNVNDNSPEFTDRCTTFFYVNHAVGEISFSPSPDDASNGKIIRYVGEEVNCTADGRPEPDFTWLVGETEISGTEGTLVTDDSMLGTREYTCVAKNVFKGEQETSRDVTIEVRAHPASAGVTLLTNLLWLQPTILLLMPMLLTWA